MRKNLLSMFLFLTFLISYGFWLGLALLYNLGVLSETDIMTNLLFAVGGFGPFIATLISLKVANEDEKQVEIINNLKRVRKNPGWYLIALILPLLWISMAWAINFMAGGDNLTSISYFMIPWVFLFMILTSGTEEFGWRGVALPILERRFNTIVATLIVGVLWTAWHLPLWFIPFAGQAESNFTLFFVIVVAFSLLLTWLYNSTRSVPVCVTFHAAANTVGAIGLTRWNTSLVSDIILSGVLVILAVTIFSIWYSSERK